jgi:hypothetical protein
MDGMQCNRRIYSGQIKEALSGRSPALTDGIVHMQCRYACRSKEILFSSEQTGRQVSTPAHHDNSGNPYRAFLHVCPYGKPGIDPGFRDTSASDIL